MILGIVNNKREAIVQFAALGSDQKRVGIKAIIDTGYTGYLTLPRKTIAELGLTWIMQETGILGDGSVCMFNMYEAEIIWDGQVYTVEINESDTEPLIGVGLLEEYELNIQHCPGGMVKITELPSS